MASVGDVLSDLELRVLQFKLQEHIRNLQRTGVTGEWGEGGGRVRGRGRERGRKRERESEGGKRRERERESISIVCLPTDMDQQKLSGLEALMETTKHLLVSCA